MIEGSPEGDPGSPQLDPPDTGSPVDEVRGGMGPAVLLLVGGFITAAAVSRMPSSNDSEGKEEIVQVDPGAEPGTTVEEAPELVLNQIELGNVTFVLEEDSGLSHDEKRELFAMLERAYNRLVQEFGAELMTYQEPFTLPVVIDHSVSEVVASLLHSPIRNADGELIDTKYTEFLVNHFEESTFAHELFHLYLERGDFRSAAFSEGHAHAVTNDLYSSNPDLDYALEYIHEPAINGILDRPWDYAPSDGTFPNEAIALSLYAFLHPHWGVLWGDFFETHPQFLADFYRNLHDRDKGVWKKEDLVSLAIEVEPDFEGWLEGDGHSVKNLHEAPSFKAVGAIAHGDSTVLTFNMAYYPGTPSLPECDPYVAEVALRERCETVIRHDFIGPAVINTGFDLSFERLELDNQWHTISMSLMGANIYNNAVHYNVPVFDTSSIRSIRVTAGDQRIPMTDQNGKPI